MGSGLSSVKETYVFGYLSPEELASAKKAAASARENTPSSSPPPSPRPPWGSSGSPSPLALSSRSGSTKNAALLRSASGRGYGGGGGGGTPPPRSLLQGAVKEVRRGLKVAKALGEKGQNRKKRPLRPNTTSQLGWICTDIVVGKSTGMSKFEEMAVIGAGLTGSVRLCRCLLDQNFCVLKLVRKDWVSKNKCAYHLFQEKKCLEELQSPLIVDLFGTFQTPKWLVFVMEYVPGGELFRRLMDSREGRFGPQTAKFYAVEILEALDYIHEKGFVYRDLKPENVLLDETGHVKLCDFGFCAPRPKDGKFHTFVGTPCYLCPEQLNGKKTDGYEADLVDWWAWGCLTYELVVGRTPFESESGKRAGDESRYEIYLRILKGKILFPVKLPLSLKTMLRHLLTPDARARLCGARKIKKHDWLKGVQWGWVRERLARPPWVPALRDEEGDRHYYEDHAAPLEGTFDVEAIKEKDFADF